MCDRESKIIALKTRLNVMRHKVWQATEEVEKISSKLQEVNKKILLLSLEGASSKKSPNGDPATTNQCTTYHSNGIGIEPQSIKRKFQMVKEILESLSEEENELSEDLEISYGSWKGVKQVVRAMEFELGELQKKKKVARRNRQRGGRRALSNSALRIIKTLIDIDKAKLAQETTAGQRIP